MIREIELPEDMNKALIDIVDMEGLGFQDANEVCLEGLREVIQRYSR